MHEVESGLRVLMKDRVMHAARGLAGTAVCCPRPRPEPRLGVEDAAVGAPWPRPWERELLRDCDRRPARDVRSSTSRTRWGDGESARPSRPEGSAQFLLRSVQIRVRSRHRLRPDGAVGILGKGALRRAAHMERRGRERLESGAASCAERHRQPRLEGAPLL